MLDRPMAAAYSGGSSSAPPRPKSPPEILDLRGKSRDMAKVQILEREICSLQEELISIQGLKPASSSCKEIADFVLTNSDPLMPIQHRKDQKASGFWSWLCGMGCFNSSCLCCFCCSECSCSLKCLACFDSCLSCPRSTSQCSRTRCCRNISCNRSCCVLQLHSSGDFLCCRSEGSSVKCSKVPFSCDCKKLCCIPC